MKCVISVDRKHIRRVTDKQASELYGEGWNYVSKSIWKEKVRDVNKEEEVNKETGKTEMVTKKSNKMSKSQKRHARKSAK
tara:strand:- start:512 stop:751 length:240 start_codon:yes stop_codon:yes gene_type:complete